MKISLAVTVLCLGFAATQLVAAAGAEIQAKIEPALTLAQN